MLLAQISDLHVRPTGERYKDAVDSNRMFADAVEHLNRLDPRPDLVLITGDLVDEGLAAEYDSLRALLGGLELPYLLMPGNHDDRERLALFFSEHAYLPASGPKHCIIRRLPAAFPISTSTCAGGRNALRR
jgi:3',5'-cyclic-AMP phosphodiesterase